MKFWLWTRPAGTCGTNNYSCSYPGTYAAMSFSTSVNGRHGFCMPCTEEEWSAGWGGSPWRSNSAAAVMNSCVQASIWKRREGNMCSDCIVSRSTPNAWSDCQAWINLSMRKRSRSGDSLLTLIDFLPQPIWNEWFAAIIWSGLWTLGLD